MSASNIFRNNAMFDALDDLFNDERIDEETFQFSYEPPVFNDTVIRWANEWVKIFNNDTETAGRLWECYLTVEDSDMMKGFHFTFEPVDQYEDDYGTDQYSYKNESVEY
jgi:hypothetical protein